MENVDWLALAKRPWRRMRGRTQTAELQICCVLKTPIHRMGTYYVRPAYFDGELWLSQQAYKMMCKQIGKMPFAKSKNPPPES